ncbi:uncharacterized protein [Rutidosis leptorrhynchoides]|uniref:uncharacterized protein n=1 Tax=Rutidosis leptorrhynchoides TaxID=125765 RepID=UPI003A99F9FA
MERSLTDELYSEILKPKGGPSVPDTTHSGLLDVEDEQWCDEESSSDAGREWQRRKDQFHAIGYRDGIIAGKEASAQEGFNVGFKESVAVGLNLGLVRGVTGALNCLPDELREKIIESQETRDKFHDLYESVNHLSTNDALKLFNDILSNKNVKQGDKLALEEQILNGSVLNDYYRRLESLIMESSAIVVQLKDNKTINVSSTSQDSSLE